MAVSNVELAPAHIDQYLILTDQYQGTDQTELFGRERLTLCKNSVVCGQQKPRQEAGLKSFRVEFILPSHWTLVGLTTAQMPLARYRRIGRHT